MLLRIVFVVNLYLYLMAPVYDDRERLAVLNFSTDRLVLVTLKYMGVFQRSQCENFLQQKLRAALFHLDDLASGLVLDLYFYAHFFHGRLPVSSGPRVTTKKQVREHIGI